MMAAPLKPTGRLTRSRKASQVIFVVALGALLLATVGFTSARQALSDAFMEVSSAQQERVTAEQRLREAELRVRFAESARTLAGRADATGFVEARWGERLINVVQAPMSREDVNNLLGSVARDETKIFGAESFELTVTRPDEGLFDTTDRAARRC